MGLAELEKIYHQTLSFKDFQDMQDVVTAKSLCFNVPYSDSVVRSGECGLRLNQLQSQREEKKKDPLNTSSLTLCEENLEII